MTADIKVHFVGYVVMLAGAIVIGFAIGDRFIAFAAAMGFGWFVGHAERAALERMKQ